MLAGEMNQDPVQWICNNTLIIGGLGAKGWEIRVAIGARPPAGPESDAREEDR
ncbi:MAG: hypothetical protein R3B96_02060 [Pirellulaceae bacterium]